MIDYKFRAETAYDVRALMLLINPEIGVITQMNTDERGDCVAVIRVIESITLGKIRQYMEEVEDGHVMVETVALVRDYTGERDYSLHE